MRGMNDTSPDDAYYQNPRDKSETRAAYAALFEKVNWAKNCFADTDLTEIALRWVALEYIHAVHCRLQGVVGNERMTILANIERDLFLRRKNEMSVQRLAMERTRLELAQKRYDLDCQRLVLRREEQVGKSEPPAAPAVDHLRRAVDDRPAARKAFEAFIQAACEPLIREGRKSGGPGRGDSREAAFPASQVQPQDFTHAEAPGDPAPNQG